MKIIEAMKKIKENKQKVLDLKAKIAKNSAHLNYETPEYPDSKEKVLSWAQACEDISRDNVKLLCRVSATNLVTPVTININGIDVTKTIAEWVWRRREYAASDVAIFSQMTDRGLQEGKNKTSTGVDLEIKIVRNYDPILRDNKILMYKTEPHMIDSKLEVINAITDLVEM